VRTYDQVDPNAAHGGTEYLQIRRPRILWSTCPDLLTPFEDFGLFPDAEEISGTVFRLPLRTPSQAAKSEISQHPFTVEDFEAIVEN
jgi:hypothetical protein